MLRAVGCALALSWFVGCINFDEAKGKFCSNNPTCKAHHVWSSRMGSASTHSTSAVQFAPNGDVVMAGSYTGATDLGGGALAAPGLSEMFVVRRAGANGAHRWSVGIGGAADDSLHGAFVDAGGDVFVGGTFASSSVTVGATSVPRVGVTDGLVARFTGGGELMWAGVIGGAGATVTGFDVTSDPSGSVFIAGGFRGTVNFVTSTETVANESMYIARFTALGALNRLIAKGTCTGAGTMRAEAVVTDETGAVFAAGPYKGECTLSSVGSAGSTSTSTGANPGLWWGKWSAGGALTYGAFAPGAGVASKVRIAINADGAPFVTAGFSGSVTPTGGEAITAVGSDVLIVAGDKASANTTFVKAGGGSGTDLATGVAVDPDGSVWVTGQFETDAAVFDKQSLFSQGASDIFVVHYSATGEVLKAVSYGDAAAQSGGGIAAAEGLGVTVGGSFAGALDFGGGALSAAAVDLFMARLKFEE